MILNISVVKFLLMRLFCIQFLRFNHKISYPNFLTLILFQNLIPRVSVQSSLSTQEFGINSSPVAQIRCWRHFSVSFTAICPPLSEFCKIVYNVQRYDLWCTENIKKTFLWRTVQFHENFRHSRYEDDPPVHKLFVRSIPRVGNVGGSSKPVTSFESYNISETKLPWTISGSKDFDASM